MVLDVLEPTTLDEACEALADGGDSAKLIAGGTALVLLMRLRLLSPDRLIALHRLPLATVEEEDGSIAIGALATHAQIASSGLVKRHYPALASAFAGVATPRIRNIGTIGGNLAQGDPHLDPPVALLALGAAVTARSLGEDREIPLDRFFVDYYETALLPGELLTQVRVPARRKGTGFSFIKHLSRSKDDYAAVDIGVWVQVSAEPRIEDVRIAIGASGATVFRAHEAEAEIRGEHPTGRVAVAAGDAAASVANPDSDTRGSADFKRQLIRVLIPRAIGLAVQDATRS